MTAPVLAELAPAKVNLYLHIVGRRDDGYHLLDSLAVFPAIGDRLTVTPAASLSLAIDGPFGEVLCDEPDNLVLRAARLLAVARSVRTGAGLRLTKRLPVASGIGGGSADAAAALRLLARHWGVTLPDASAVAALGADVPVCMAGLPARMGGIGDRLAPAPGLPACGMVLVNPGVAVSTPAIFRARPPGASPPASLPTRWPDFAGFVTDLADMRNDLEATACALCPDILEVLAELRAIPGCALARMSGSGATCFGLFTTPSQASAAAVAVSRPGWWSWGGSMGVAEPGRAT